MFTADTCHRVDELELDGGQNCNKKKEKSTAAAAVYAGRFFVYLLFKSGTRLVVYQQSRLRPGLPTVT